MRALTVVGFVLCTAIAACSTERLEPARTEWALEPGTFLDFGEVPALSRRTRSVFLKNNGALDLEATIRVDGPWDCADSTVRVPGGSQRSLSIEFAPDTEGRFDGTLRVTSESKTMALALTGSGGAPCAAQHACVISVFDDSSGDCVEEAVPDDTPCTSGCLPEGRCLDGHCRGTSTCKDGNPCTADVCGDSGACVFEPTQCPKPANPCLAALCDPSTGCFTAPVVDGTSCGRTGCDVSDVCIAGQCVERPVPEGGPCGVATYCRSRGTCRSGVCDQPRGQIEPLWFEQGFYGNLFSDAVGNLYFLRIKVPAWDKRVLTSLDSAGNTRWELDLDIDPDLWSLIGGAIIGATPRTMEQADPAPSKVYGWSAANGSLLWTIDLKGVLAAELAGLPTVTDVLVQSVFEDAAGDIGLIVETDRYLPRAVWLLTVEPTTGAVLHSLRIGQEILGGAVVSGTDFIAQLDLGTAGASSRGFASMDTAGGLNWILPARYDTYPVAMTAAGPVGAWDPYPYFANMKCGVLDGNGNLVVALPNGSCVQPVVSDAERVYAVHDLAGSAARSIGVSAHSLSAGTMLWSRELFEVKSGFLNRATSAPILTDEGTIVIGVRETSGAANPSQLVLYDIAVDGRILSACATPPDASFDFSYSDPTIIANGTWITEGVSPVGRGLIAFPLPNRSPAKYGWSMPDGNPQRTRRLR